MNVAALLHAQATLRPDAPAIIERRGGRTRTTTFAALDRAAAQAAALLRREGLAPGDAALVLHPVSSDLYVALAALLRLGLVAMFLDPSAGRAHVERCCALVPPRALIASPKAHALRIISPGLRRIPHKFSVGPALPGATRWGGNGLTSWDAFEDCKPDAAALLTFTSGSMGWPKAAVRTHGFLLAQYRVLEQSLALAPGEVDLVTLPIVLLANLASGVTSLIPDADLRRPGAIDPAPVVDQIQAHRPVRTAASLAFLDRLAGYCAPRRIALSSFTRIYSGGAPVFPRMLDEFQGMAPQAEVCAVYGSTEAEPIAHVARSQMHANDIEAMYAGRGLLVGRPVPAIQLRILPDRWGTPIGPYTDEALAAVSLPPGAPGEIVVSGAHVLSGYLHGEGDKEAKFTVGGSIWHRTGDAGYLDAKGRLWLLGRCAARIADLYPFSVEGAVLRYAAIHRAAVVAHRGERVLLVQWDARATRVDLAEIREYLTWAKLDAVIAVPEIPLDKRHNAKVDYPAAQRLLERVR